jgi:pyruvate/2-oxoacid:ferredoxin oxidoreductase beta subunit
MTLKKPLNLTFSISGSEKNSFGSTTLAVTPGIIFIARPHALPYLNHQRMINVFRGCAFIEALCEFVTEKKKKMKKKWKPRVI